MNSFANRNRVTNIENNFMFTKGKGTPEDETVGWHHQLNGHEFEQALRVGDEQGLCCSPWGLKESDMTEQWNNTHTHGLCW